MVYEDIFDAKNACEHLSGFNVSNRYLVVLYYQVDEAFLCCSFVLLMDIGTYIVNSLIFICTGDKGLPKDGYREGEGKT